MAKPISQLEYFTAVNIHSSEVTAIFTTRNGGVSGKTPELDYLSSLNLQIDSRYDTGTNIAENYHIIASSLGFNAIDVMRVKQIHTDEIMVVDEKIAESRPHHILGEADALLTNVKGILLSIRIADCIPILLYDNVNEVVGAVHAGWQGTYMNIATKAMKCMGELYGSNPADIRVAIGSAIGSCCYEVDLNFYEKFYQKYGNIINAFFVLKPGEKPYCDLKAMNKAFLSEAGIDNENIEVSDLCTMCNPALFYSHRRSSEKRGTMAAFIGMK